MKKLLSTSIACTIFASAVINEANLINLNAKVIEPEICHVETWTTSYYIDDDKDTLYPYVDCKAEIYNDGKVVVTFWNTREWDGFATVSHDVAIEGTVPYSTDSDEYAYKYHLKTDDWGRGNPEIWDKIDLNYYPSDYNHYYYSNTARNFGSYLISSSDGVTWQRTGSYSSDDGVVYIKKFIYPGALPKLPVNDLQDTQTKLTFTPKVDVTKKYEFYLLGHKFEVTPELLKTSTVATPQADNSEAKIKELESKISELEEQVRTLSEENENLKVKKLHDFNDDGVVNTLDLVCFIKFILSV